MKPPACLRWPWWCVVVLGTGLWLGAGRLTAHDTGETALRLTASAQAVLAAFTPAQKEEAVQPFAAAARTRWSYVPGTRPGVALGELDATQRAAVWALVHTATSEAGHRRVQGVVELESVLRELEGRWRDPGRYWLVFFGTPGGDAPWSWRLEGHHLSLNVTLDGRSWAVDTPMFLGANPAGRKLAALDGAPLLAEEGELAWRLLESLDTAARAQAIVSDETYGEILTRNAPQVEALATAGLPAAAMTEAQRQALLRLVETFAAHASPELAAARMARVREGGLEAMRFVWAGPTRRGGVHYWRVQGPKFLLEWDASQGGGDHVHTVWRDYERDFGRDLLREHRAAEPHE